MQNYIIIRIADPFKIIETAKCLQVKVPKMNVNPPPLKHTTTLFSLSDHDILSRKWRVIVDQMKRIGL